MKNGPTDGEVYMYPHGRECACATCALNESERQRINASLDKAFNEIFLPKKTSP